jgi:hypothetical protein
MEPVLIHVKLVRMLILHILVNHAQQDVQHALLTLYAHHVHQVSLKMVHFAHQDVLVDTIKAMENVLIVLQTVANV